MSTLAHGAPTNVAAAPVAPPLDRPQAESGLRVSVVVPTYRRPELVTRCLESLVAQSMDPRAYEVLVVDDGHDRETMMAVQAVAARHAGTHAIRYLRPPNGRGPAVARNCGWRFARAGIVAFTDDDTIPDRDWLAQGVAALGDGVDAVAGRVRVPLASGDASGPVRPTDHELMTQGLERAEFVTANAFVRQTALAAVGGFDARFGRAWREDSDLQFSLMQRNSRIVRSDAAVVEHPVRAEPWGVSLRQQKNVFYDALLFKKHPQLYRERILASPPWNYYAIVALSIAAALFIAVGNVGSAAVSAIIAAGLILAFALRRLRPTSRSPDHVVEMLLTSVAIPYLSVYWRLRGAIHFRVAYL